MTRLRLAFTLMGVCSLALGLVGPASAGARSQSKYGGTLVVVEAGGLTSGLDPTLPGARNAQEVIRTFCQGLYDVGTKGHVVPLLASALPTISKDKLTYTIPIRKGILFNDGTPFNAQAVVTTLRRDMTLPGSFRAPDLALLDTVVAPNPSTVVIHLKAPFTPLTGLLAAEAGEIMSPTQLATLGASFGTDPVCVGPFMFDHLVAGDNITVIKSPYYYDKYAVHLDKIVFKSISDAAAATAALRAGDVQAIDSVSTTALPSISGDPGLTVLHQNTLGYNALFINIGNTNGHPPYSNIGTPLASNPSVRKAFEEAIDRDALNRVLFDSQMQPGCTPLAPASPWYDDSIPCTPYNPKDAKTLLARAGVPNLTVHLLTGTTTDNLRIAQFVQAQEAAVGINVIIDSLDSGSVVARLEAGNFDVFLGGSGTGDIDPDTLISQRNATSGSTNQSGYSNPRLDLILDNGRKALSEKARRTLYHAAEMIIANDRPAIYLYHPVRFSAFNSNLTGVQLRPDGFLRVAFAQYK
jgi:peptide/nickel transport system substrate-binding protein